MQIEILVPYIFLPGKLHLFIYIFGENVPCSQ